MLACVVSGAGSLERGFGECVLGMRGRVVKVKMKKRDGWVRQSCVWYLKVCRIPRGLFKRDGTDDLKAKKYCTAACSKLEDC